MEYYPVCIDPDNGNELELSPNPVPFSENEFLDAPEGYVHEYIQLESIPGNTSEEIDPVISNRKNIGAIAAVLGIILLAIISRGASLNAGPQPMINSTIPLYPNTGSYPREQAYNEPTEKDGGDCTVLDSQTVFCATADGNFIIGIDENGRVFSDRIDG